MKKEQKEAIVQVRDLVIEFGTGKKAVKAVKGVTFDVFKGETFGLVGESGSGKTTVGRAVMGIQPISDGTIYFNSRVAYGAPPNLHELNLKIKRNLKIMQMNQNTTTVRLNEYIAEFKRIYYKYIESMYYEFKTGEVKPYTDGVDRKIAEGVNLKDTKIIKVKKDINLEYINEAIEDNLKRLLKVIRLQQKTIRFVDRISDYADVNVDLETAIVKYQKEAYEFVIGIKDLENNIHQNIQEMKEIRENLKKGEYTSVKKFFNDMGSKVEEVVRYHKSISTLLEMAIKKHNFNIDLSVDGKAKRKRISSINFQIEKNKTRNNILLVEEFNNILKLMEYPNVQKQVNKSDNFKLPNKKDKHNLKKQMQMIFQDPASSLNDRMAVEQIIAEGLDNFPEIYKNDETRQVYVDWFNANEEDESKHITLKKLDDYKVKKFLILELLTTVGMLPEHLSRYPHEFSGGQRQRIGIARALIMKPSFIVADEPISALDVSIRAQVMNLLAKFQKEFDLTYIFIAHDLSVVRFVANRIAVIYRGDIVELAEADELFFNPLHPYTKSLLSAVPLPDPEQERNKVHYKYQPEIEHADYITDFPQWVEVKNGHYVYANERELKNYKKQYNQYLKNNK
ncbi:ATP-binding cassette domain-containing protein [Mesoplasma photuris]|uniref:ATP-binding cassette domain-containing protein n=1 Tax=Mesoplasma photuris TaxID=217731 RepID=UPI0004E19D2B|nr:ATP-binding cassette domain-containing protein [Mesoplasma photuris]